MEKFSGYNLPLPLTSFIGRENELAEIKQLLHQSRLVTLTGPGGVGKTRLALQYAHARSEAAPDRAETCFVELAALLNGQFLLETVAQALSLKDFTGQPLIEALVTYLKDRSTLVVLDNCEHLLEDCARLSALLLGRCPALRILATSREPLGIDGEVLLRLPSLTSPDLDAEVNPRKLGDFEAVRLFLERVRAADQGFTLSRENSRAVAVICSRLDGIPLALELAAARTRTLPVELLAERLDSRFRLLAGGNRLALPRQQTLLAMVEWSYNLLAAKERVLLRRLGLFAGTWTVEAAEDICANPGELPEGSQPTHLAREEVLELLSQLVNKSLVQWEREGSCYRLLDTLRFYARQKLAEAGETALYSRRYRDWYLQLAETAAPTLTSPAQLTWKKRLVKERDNFRAALGWSLERGEIAEAFRLVRGLGYFWYSIGNSREEVDWLEQIYSRAGPNSLPPDLQVLLYNELGKANHYLGRYPRAEFFHRQAIQVWEELGDKESLAKGLLDLGWCYWFQLKNAPAEEYAEKSLALALQTTNRWSVAAALQLKGRIFCHDNRAAAALPLVEECLALWRELNDLDSISSSLLLKGQVLITLGRAEEAKPALAEALDLDLKLNNFVGLEIALQEIARLCAGAFPQPAGARAGAALLGFIHSRFGGKELMGRIQPAITGLRKAGIIAELKGHLGEDAYKREYAAGASLTQAEALELAQARLRPEEKPGPSLPPQFPDGLTGREVEILQLVAAGLSNPAIAAKLVLSRRTVEAHLHSIFNKLEVTSRAGAVRYALEHKLA
jgi:non-specific serine/threonine protein kinase